MHQKQLPKGKKVDFHSHAILEDAAKVASAILSAEEMNHLETLADKAEVNTIREWEKKMD